MNKNLKHFLTTLLSAVCVFSVATSAGCFRKDKEKTTDVSLRTDERESETISSECPFSLSDNAEWTYYPPDNFMGLVAMGRDLDEADQTFILVFDKDVMDENAEQIFTGGSVSSTCFYGFYDYEDSEVEEQDGNIYAKLKCDNRIKVCDFCFSYSDENINEREIISIYGYDEADKMELMFAHYDYNYSKQTTNTKKTQ